MKLVVVALNPSIDAEWRVGRVLPEEKNEVLGERRWPGGKGVNVARWLRHLGHPAELLLPLGGSTGDELATDLRSEGLPATVVTVRQPTRVNVIVTPATGPQLRFNPVWRRLSLADWRKTLQQIRASLAGTSYVVLSGSLPNGVPHDAYARIIREARRAGVPAVLDCEGKSFAAAVAARPFLVKPNQPELASWAGRSLPSEAAVVKAAFELSSATHGWVLVSCGGEGALLVQAKERRVYRASAPKVRVLNTVGAGDALLAAVVASLARSESPECWLQWGVATGSAATACPAGILPPRREIARAGARQRVADQSAA